MKIIYFQKTVNAEKEDQNDTSHKSVRRMFTPANIRIIHFGRK